MRDIILKGTVNKKTKQVSITIPKKQFKKLNPQIKFDENSLFKVTPYRKGKE